MLEQTLSIIKPDATAKNIIGKIITRFEDAGLKMVAAKLVWLTEQQARDFYAVHRDKPFLPSLIQCMISGPILVQVLEGDNAILSAREIMGATDPKDAAAGTIRADFADDISCNAVHGSDAPDTAQWEIDFFFAPEEICVIR